MTDANIKLAALYGNSSTIPFTTFDNCYPTETRAPQDTTTQALERLMTQQQALMPGKRHVPRLHQAQ
jgi:hypothetical protein